MSSKALVKYLQETYVPDNVVILYCSDDSQPLYEVRKQNDTLYFPQQTASSIS